MKTIAQLNSKIWYRFLKVCFIMLIVVACIIPVSIFFNDSGSYQVDHLVVCKIGNQKTFLAYKDEGIYISEFGDYSKSLASLPDTTKVKLRIACGMSEEEIVARAKSYLEGKTDGSLYNISATKIPFTGYTELVLWSIFSILMVLFFAEIIRRIFYYIIFGTIKPLKK